MRCRFCSYASLFIDKTFLLFFRAAKNIYKFIKVKLQAGASDFRGWKSFPVNFISIFLEI
ncbi:hypothetical protein GZ77_23515 [Endozoicomonas montiporae]|uniref:Uncharacterized protein n=1 Tax=Endozoicomonas montiporae TaxID=1027273 RepID=A0A081N0S8_9GAMM|nr:hypothetical protein GZ77_23515 [Endozoicomonas montiporae]